MKTLNGVIYYSLSEIAEMHEKSENHIRTAFKNIDGVPFRTDTNRVSKHIPELEYFKWLAIKEDAGDDMLIINTKIYCKLSGLSKEHCFDYTTASNALSQHLVKRKSKVGRPTNYVPADVFDSWLKNRKNKNSNNN